VLLLLLVLLLLSRPVDLSLSSGMLLLTVLCCIACRSCGELLSWPFMLLCLTSQQPVLLYWLLLLLLCNRLQPHCLHLLLALRSSQASCGQKVVPRLLRLRKG
jgi:hypothetical protein